MKKLLTFALALMVLAVFAGLGVAQEERRLFPQFEKGHEEKRLPPVGPPPPDVKMKQPSPSSKQLTGKVTGVDPTGKTFTVMSKGQAVTFSAARLPGLPEVGEIIDITYTETPGAQRQVTTINNTKSNTY